MSKNGKKNKPTHEDAMVMLGLIQASGMFGVGDAFAIIYADDFPADPDAFWAKYPMSSEGGQAVIGSMRYFETIGTLVRNGLFNEDLAYDWLSITVPWDKLKLIAEKMREGGPAALWENFEYIAERQRNWKPKR
jgi:hypothetical protein